MGKRHLRRSPASSAGLLLGFDSFMWKESVVINRISLFGVPWLMVVALCLMRWIYAPHQRRYLYIGDVLLRHVRDDPPDVAGGRDGH